MPDLLTFDVAFTADRESRTLTGRLVPFGVVSRPARDSTGRTARYSFGEGTIRLPEDPSDVVLNYGHDTTSLEAQVGSAIQFTATPEGIDATFRIARTPEGDRVLALADPSVKVLKFFSAEINGQFETDQDGVRHGRDTELTGAAVVRVPAFVGADITSVAASAAQHPKEEPAMGDENTQTEEQTAATAVDFSQVTTAVQDGITAAFAGLQFPQREVVPTTYQVQVREELPYRFDGGRGEHSFLGDIQLAYASNDGEARQRLDTFMEEAFAQFAVTSTNVGSLNPTQNRPELYVPNLQYTRPLWELCSTGTLEDKTPFTVPKFSSASGLVGNHTEGTEPTPGAFQATVQTVTPGPVSGKIEINREVWDQGGSPQADQIIWGEMVNAYFEAIEAKIAAALKTTATAELNLAGAVDGALIAALTNYFAGLQFVRGGNRFTAFAADQKLFPALVAAKDSAGRPLLPVLGPNNAQGTTDGGFDRVQLGAQTVRAAWALSQGTNTMSFNFVPSSVWAWASAPKQFKFEYQLKSIDMGIWGYTGTAILRDSDVKPVDYDTSDA